MKTSPITLFMGVMLICVAMGVQGQDPQFSQFYNSSIYYNPATAGLTQDLRFNTSYRDLWTSIPGDLSTYFFSMDYQWTDKNVGLGLLMMNDNEGLHNLRTQRLELVYSYRIQSRNRMLQFGMSAISLNVRDLQNDEFVFTDQLDPIHGVVQQSAFVPGQLDPKVYPDWNVGLVYRQNFSRNQRYFLTPTIGFSASHIFRPNVSLINDKVRLPVKYLVHSSILTRFAFKGKDPFERKYAFLSPGFIFEYQNPFQTLSMGTGLDIYPFRFGLWFRNQSFLSSEIGYNSVIVLAGIVIPVSLNHNLILDYTYDSTVSQLEFSSGGAHELTLIYNISLPEKRKSLPCFREWWRPVMGMKHYSKGK